MSDNSGNSVASAGDVNGDGFDDLIIGADGAAASGVIYGASYVVFGQAAAFAAEIELSTLSGTDGFRISGEAALDASGDSVASAGDVNGDGFDDVIVGAPYADPNGFSSGASYVVFGQAGGFAPTIELSALDGTDGFQLSGEAAYDGSGSSVASAGDVNGDGFADLIIGAPFADPSGSFSGASYVVFGQAGEFAASIELSDLDGTNGFQISGEAALDVSGRSVASAGDVNGDGFDDLIIGADAADSNGSYSGSSYVVFGQAGEFAASIELSDLDGTNGFQISGEAAGDVSGYSVASAGDVNGDGLDDLVIGALFADPNGQDSGASYVIFGRAGGFAADIELSGLDGTDGFRIRGEAAGDRSGFSVASAGDVNGDGFDDLIIGARDASGDVGASYVVFGHAGSFADIELSGLDGTDGFRIRGEAAGDRSGFSVASGGDVNGDGFDDLIIGAPYADPNGNSVGASYVVFGQAGGFAPEIELSDLDGASGFQLNGGDPNADQVIVGTPSGDDLEGGGGNDIIRGKQGDDVLSGNNGNDRVWGCRGQDTISGGTGDDVLGIVLGENTLTFADNDGADTVVGYKPGIDHFDLTAVSVLNDFSDLSLTASGDDVLVDYGSGSFLLKNTTPGSVEANDFWL